MIVGRLAPSPTGAQHLGNARTYLLAWLSVRHQQARFNQAGRILLRIEDLDSPRIKAWAKDQAIQDLRWLGLDWDVGPGDEADHHFPSLLQSQRVGRYEEILNELKSLELVYPCTCSRREAEQAASAPHESMLEGSIYPGTCARRRVSDHWDLLSSGQAFAWRFRIPAGEFVWQDGVLGRQIAVPSMQLGDFVVGRSYDVPAYQLAVVVDDHDMQVTEVVRGNDLIASTYRQIAIYQALGWTPPAFKHVPLVVGPDGRRLAKRHGDTRLSTLRQEGIQPETVIGYLAWTAGLLEGYQPVTAIDLVGTDPMKKLTCEPTLFPYPDAVEYFRSLQIQ